MLSLMRDFTICIVTYNNAEKIAQVARGITDHIPDRYSYRLYIMDNNSPDGTLDHAQGISPHIELVQTGENLGFGKAHNRVISKTPANVHFIVNPDIYIDGPIFGQMYEFMLENPGVGLAAAGVCGLDGQLQHHGKRNPTLRDLFIRLVMPGRFLKRQARYMMLEQDFTKVFDLDVASGCFICARTEVLRKIGGFDEKFFLYFEDADLSRRAKKISRVVYFPNSHVRHEWNRDSRRNIKMLIIMIKSAMRYLFKWSFGGVFARENPELPE